MDSILFSPVIIILLTIGVVFVVTAVTALSKSKQTTSRYRSQEAKYAIGNFSPQMELDIRLPYRRFKQLYPNSLLTYEQYKQLQKQRAFKRSRSSQDNDRMVR
ncbi:MAG: hypothetical protein NWF00_04375 [Candidatus Bathyarchaeota archaeon]|nr:hypothetical protein [Candidatus Bathyarchaeota archaeon]